MARPRRAPVPTFALDLAADAIRAVLLDRPQRNGIPLRAAFDAPMPKGAVDHGAISDIGGLAAAVRHLVNDKKRAHVPRYVVASIPDEQSFTLTVTVAKSDQADLHEAIRWEVVQHVPYRVEELSINWQLIKEEKEQSTFQVVAAPRVVLDAYAAVLDQAGLVPVGFEVATFAALRTLELPEEPASLLLCIGWSSTTATLVTNEGLPLSLTTPTFSGERCTGLLTERLKLKPREAAKAITVCGLEKACSRGVVRHALWTEFKDLLDLLQQLSSYRTLFSKTGIGSIILTGSQSRVKALGQELHEKSGYRVFENPVRRIIIPTVRDAPMISPDDLPGYATAFGLALMSQ